MKSTSMKLVPKRKKPAKKRKMNYGAAMLRGKKMAGGKAGCSSCGGTMKKMDGGKVSPETDSNATPAKKAKNVRTTPAEHKRMMLIEREVTMNNRRVGK